MRSADAGITGLHAHEHAWWAVLMLCLSLTLACSSSPPPAQPAPAAAYKAADPSPPLRPGDMIRVRIWREPDFSGDFQVEQTGIVVLPRLGPLNVTSVSPDTLQARLIREYRRFLSHTSIDVVFLRQVEIVGAVQKPGPYHVDPKATLADALALAGGATPDGRPDEVEIVRDGKTLPGTISGRTQISQSPVQSGDQLYVPLRSWVSRNPGAVIAASITAVSTLTYVLVH